MGMIKCKECEQQVSNKAKACPHCGAARPTNRKGCLIVFIVVALISFFMIPHCADFAEKDGRLVDSLEGSEQATTPDITIIDWSVDDAVRTQSGKFVKAIVRVKLKNSTNTGGQYKATLNGLDADDYPVFKQRLDIETYMPPLGTVQDAEEMTFYAHEWDGISSWKIIVEPRGY